MRPFKRARFGRPRRGFRSRFGKRRARAQGYTTSSGSGHATGFRSRRLGRRRWRSVLWRDTIAVQHYRSYAHRALTIAIPAGVGNGVVHFVPMIGVQNNAQRVDHVGTEFWTGAGGAQPEDDNTVGAYRGDLTIRGGICRLTLSNPDVGDSLRVVVYAVFGNPNPRDFIALLQDQPRSSGWDPSSQFDFKQFGRVVYSREFMLEPGGKAFTLVHRLKPQKIDQDIYRGSTVGVIPATVRLAGSQWYWWIFAVPVSDYNTTGFAISGLTSFNLSFTGDTTS